MPFFAPLGYYSPFGNRTVNRMLSCSLSAVMLPPWSSTISFAMASPSPAPPVAEAREESTR